MKNGRKEAYGSWRQKRRNELSEKKRNVQRLPCQAGPTSPPSILSRDFYRFLGNPRHPLVTHSTFSSFPIIPSSLSNFFVLSLQRVVSRIVGWLNIDNEVSSGEIVIGASDASRLSRYRETRGYRARYRKSIYLERLLITAPRSRFTLRSTSRIRVETGRLEATDPVNSSTSRGIDRERFGKEWKIERARTRGKKKRKRRKETRVYVGMDVVGTRSEFPEI